MHIYKGELIATQLKYCIFKQKWYNNRMSVFDILTLPANSMSKVDYAPYRRPREVLHVEYFRRPDPSALVLPPPLPLEMRTSRAALDQLLRPLIRAFIVPKLRHHGIKHGVRTAIIAAALSHIVPFTKHPRALLLLVLTAFLHDSRRTGDWELSQQWHARRGEAFVGEHGEDLLPELGEEELRIVRRSIGRHSLRRRDKTKRPATRARLAALSDDDLAEDLSRYSLAEVVECLLREADVLDLIRGYYTGPVLSKTFRTARRIQAHIPGLPYREAVVDRLVFPHSPWLLPLADAMAQLDYTDPDICTYLADDPLSATLEAGLRVGLLAP
jgi:hypothetical protein